ncbi:DNA/RNA helicase domain-containing protein [Pseudomonas donghuensis]|uniref:DNA/RNA helicase domain-containing protein n=1 Tax=Pseudomonas donghuensis TaxID=1163398 RepID=UPI00029A9CDD|nr:DNA/RNA helicase domain-containing protein [Pseudomonas donghuensis]
MKYINILSLVQANTSLTPAMFDEFLTHHNIKIKPAEVEDLKGLVGGLYGLSGNASVFSAFYVGYQIPQIGKEFDLLRFGKDNVVNIELKKTCSEEKIKDQLVRNRYYLSCVGRYVYCFTYVSDVKALYYLKDDNCLVKVDLSSLRDLLASQEINREEIVDDLFNPSDYLVSPFNSTQKFLRDEYFLTHQQEEIRSRILQYLTGPKMVKFISVIGSAGTGKTLLVYDISKQYTKLKKSNLIIHCGQLNEGHVELMGCGWDIIPIKSYLSYDLAKYDLVIVDESQRVRPHQLNDIIAKVQASSGSCIFSYDKLQTLANWEERSDIDASISSIKNLVVHKLSEKIRTNKEIANFIRVLFNNKRNLPLSSTNNIELSYFNSLEDARSYLATLDECGWEVLRFTPSQYGNEHHEKYCAVAKKTSHRVIGQEFDSVAIPIDQYFSYNSDGELYYKGSAYYNMTKMLFQNITRARKRLNVVIIGNQEILNRCMSVLR